MHGSHRYTPVPPIGYAMVLIAAGLAGTACLEPDPRFIEPGSGGLETTATGDETGTSGEAAMVEQCIAQGKSWCDGACIDAGRNVEHCGGCDQPCAGNQVCAAGECVIDCPAGQIVCQGACVDPMADAAHCGACGRACDGAQTCTSGRCGALVCEEGFQACDHGCVDVRSDPLHCGACGAFCAAPTVCLSGRCRCEDGLTMCNADCVDLQSDDAHCGECNRACPGNKQCVSATCIK